MKTSTAFRMIKHAHAREMNALRGLIRAEVASAKKAGKHGVAHDMERLMYSLGDGGVSAPQVLPNGVLTRIEPDRICVDLDLPESVWKPVGQLCREWGQREALGDAGLWPSHKVLLHGPPGCGKTSLSAYLAKSLCLPLVQVGYHQLISSFLGETGAKLFKVFEEAERIGSCLLLIDEFDSIGKARGDAKDVGEMSRIVNSLLIYLDRMARDVLLVATTNRVDLLDPALARRFDLFLEVPAPGWDTLARFVESRHGKWTIPHDVTNYAEADRFGRHMRKMELLRELEAARNEIRDKGGREAATA